jgi:hypothetical protein
MRPLQGFITSSLIAMALTVHAQRTADELIAHLDQYLTAY